MEDYDELAKISITTLEEVVESGMEQNFLSPILVVNSIIAIGKLFGKYKV